MISAFTAVISGTGKGFGIGRADLGTKGYTPCPTYGTFQTFEAASEYAEKLNGDKGLKDDDAVKIILSTMTPAQRSGEQVLGDIIGAMGGECGFCGKSFFDCDDECCGEAAVDPTIIGPEPCHAGVVRELADLLGVAHTKVKS
jgi:hypothetical protein